MGGGGGGKTGGTVVQSTSPWAALQAGQYGAAAADQANMYATNAMNTAISSMNKQYQNAVSNLTPYTTTGVEALDKLNSFLGLSAYKPNAPTAPTAPNLDDYIRQYVTHGDVVNYINQNSHDGYYYGAGMGDHPLTMAEVGGASATNPGAVGNVALDQAIQAHLANPMYQTALNAYNNVDLPNYNQAKAQYDQAQALYDQYQAAGPKTQAQITEEIANQPGYQSQLQQGVDAIGKNASAKGYIGSGAILKGLMDYGQNTFGQYYGNTLSQLAGLASQGQQSASTIAGLQANNGNSLAQLYQSLGENQANSALARGNALAQGLIAGNQNYTVMGQSDIPSSGGGIGDALGGVASLAKAFGFSSKALKDKIATPSTEEILAKVNELELDKWKYKNIDREHIGPYAEQWSELFGGNGQSINMIDVCGVLLASVKALSAKIDKLQSEK